VTTTNRHDCWLPAEGAAIPARTSVSIFSGSTARSSYFLMLRRPSIASIASTHASRSVVAVVVDVVTAASHERGFSACTRTPSAARSEGPTA
jgi:hypothetical protein